MSQEQPQRPVTYGDVFLNVPGDIAEQAVTPEDAALMQSAEALATGRTHKHGAASAMQAAAARNVQFGFVAEDAHSPVAETGVTVVETVLPGALLETEYVAGQAVVQTASPLPTRADIAASEAVTIGEALEAAAVGAGDRPVQLQDARAIQSAEARATGLPAVVPGGLAATAQSAAELNLRDDVQEATTLGDVLVDATVQLYADKVVTQEDAAKIREAELRGGDGEIVPGGVAASMQAAADLNERAGLLSATQVHGLRGDARNFSVEDKPDRSVSVSGGDDSVPNLPSGAGQTTAGGIDESEKAPLLGNAGDRPYEENVPKPGEKFPDAGVDSTVA